MPPSSCRAARAIAGCVRRATLRPLLAAAFAVASAAPAIALERVDDFGANPGEVDLFVHVPQAFEEGGAMVVALHGCTQSATDFDDEPGLVALAEAVPFVLLLPQQREANNEQRCFNFFRDEDNRPGLGESGSIRNMIAHAVETYAVDPNRVHVLGLSAGGAMTAVMLANYPELFAGGAILAGAPFDCNRPTTWNYGVWWWLRTFVGEAAAASFACGILGPSATDRSAGNWGEAVRAISEATPERWPRVSIWHGDADDVVDPANRRELVEQWTNVHGIDAEPDDSRTQGEVVHEIFADDAGVALVEAWRLIDFPHAVAIDPDAEPVACGVAAEFIEPAGICSIRRIASFWGLLP